MTIKESNNEVLLQGISQLELESGVWSLDIGATHHIIDEKGPFYELDKSYQGKARFGDDSRIDTEGRGNILVKSLKHRSISQISVLCMPKLKGNVQSVVD